VRLDQLTAVVRLGRRLQDRGVTADAVNTLAQQLEEGRPLVTPAAFGFDPEVQQAVQQFESVSFEPAERADAAAKLRSLPVLPAGTRVPVLVFVHGIFSTAFTAFREMYRDFASAGRYWCALFDYDFHAEMRANGALLASSLADLNDRCDVTLICHSMGGLIGRLAVLSGTAPSIRRVLMIGTPNFGALRTAQLGLLSQLALAATGVVYGVFRKPGIRDLTRVAEVFRDLVEEGAHHSDDVEYVTIPGAYFHEGRRIYEIGNWGEWQLWSAAFAALNLGSEFLTAMQPLWKVGLEKPHDGIVERRSNCFVPAGPGRHSEKNGVLSNSSKFGRTYIHVEHAAADRLTHVLIQHDPDIIALVRSILEAPTLLDWYDGLTREQLRRLDITFP